MITYSQNFEDVILNRLFGGKTNGFYIDVGAHDPTELSVTKHFYDLGWNGINIEPIPESFKRMVTARTRDINLNIAIADKSGTLPFYIVVDEDSDKEDVSALSSFDKDSVINSCKRFTIEWGRRLTYQEIEVETSTLEKVCEEYCCGEIDFLKIDVEGAEATVLSSANFEKYRPVVLVIEAKKTYTNPLKDPVEVYQDWESYESIIFEAGYQNVYFDGLNRFYLRKESLSLKHFFDVPVCMYDKFVFPDQVEARSRISILEKQNDELETRNSELIKAYEKIQVEISENKETINNLELKLEEIVSENRRLQSSDYYLKQLNRTQKSANMLKSKLEATILEQNNLLTICADFEQIAREQYEKNFRLSLAMHAWKNKLRRSFLPSFLLPTIPLPTIPERLIKNKQIDGRNSNNFKNISGIRGLSKASFNKTPITCGKYFLFPDKIGDRVAEGGRRLRGRVEKTQPNFPLVSVITTVRNCAGYIEQAILSVLNQTYKNIEYIVIDAKSDDGTLEIIKSYEESIDYYISESDNGIYSGMNKGIMLASGDYIIILNGDDYYTKDAIEKLVREAVETRSDIVAAHSCNINENGEVITGITGGLSRSSWTPFAYIVCPLKHETMLAKVTVYNDIGGYNEALNICADWYWMAQVYHSHCYEVSIVNENLLYFRKVGVSQNRTFAEKHVEERLLAYSTIFNGVEKVDLEKLKWIGKIDTKIEREMICKYPDNKILREALKARDIWAFATRST